VRLVLPTYHDQGGDDPVDDNTETELYPDLAFTEDLVQLLVLNFAQDGIHHHQQPNG